MRTTVLVLALVFQPLVFAPLASSQAQRGADSGPVAQLNDARKLAEQAINQLRVAQSQTTELAGSQLQSLIETLNTLQLQLVDLQKSPNREAVIGAAEANNRIKQNQLQARANFTRQQLTEGAKLQNDGNQAAADARFSQAAQQGSKILEALEGVVARLAQAAQSAKNSPTPDPGPPRPPTLERLLTLPATAPKASLEGVVFDADTRKPVSNATVSLLRSDDRLAAMIALIEDHPKSAPIVPVTTDESGRFAFRTLEADSYTLTVFKLGYTLQADQVLETDVPGTPVKLQVGMDITNLELSLERNGSLSGNVRDINGNPASGVPVQLVRLKNSPRLVAETRSNDRGEYRVDDVVPGPYILAAGNALTLNSLTQTLQGANREYGYTFIDLVVGASRTFAADFSLGPEQRHRIRGRVVDETSGSWPAAVTGSLTSIAPTGIARGNFAENDSLVHYEPRDGTFEVSDLLPGTYTIFLRARVGSRDLVGHITVVVADADIAQERIVLSAPGQK